MEPAVVEKKKSGFAVAFVEIVTEPFEAEVIPMLLPATRYEVPSVSFVRDPDKPELNLTGPVKVVPLTVATTESFIERVYEEPAPPSRDLRPLPAVSDLSLESVASLPTVR